MGDGEQQIRYDPSKAMEPMARLVVLKPAIAVSARSSRARRRTPRAPSDGFTLLELLLVLGLVVAIAAMAAPALRRPLENHRLKRTAEDVRNDWARTRIRAMEMGQTFIFRYEPQGRHYVIEPWETEGDYLESSDLNQPIGMLAGTSGVMVPPTPMEETVIEPEQRELPENIVFAGSESILDARAIETMGDPSLATATSQWSEPIFFYPDGTTSDARLALSNQYGRSVMITIRGLTGLIKVSELMTTEQLP